MTHDSPRNATKQGYQKLKSTKNIEMFLSPSSGSNSFNVNRSTNQVVSKLYFSLLSKAEVFSRNFL